MKKMMFTIVVAGMIAGLSAPAHAQLGGLLDKAQKAQDAKKKYDSLTVNDEATPLRNDRRRFPLAQLRD